MKCGRGFHCVTPSWHTNADSTSTWRKAGIHTRILLRRGAELESKREFYLGVARSLNVNADFISAWRRTEIRTRIPLQRSTELTFRRGFHFGVAPS